MNIGGFQPQSLIEYPGKVSSIVFLAGCNFRCPFCYNVDLVLPDRIKRMKKADDREVISHLKEDKLIDAVCVTGGEPTLQKGLSGFLEKVKRLGFLTALETNGTNPDVLKQLLEAKLLDKVMMDIKSSKEGYDEAAGVKVNLNKIEKSISLIRKAPDYEFRMTVVPGLHDINIIRDIGKWLKGAKTFVLQQFRPDKTLNPDFQLIKPYTEEQLERFKKELEPYFDEVIVRNV